MSKMKTFLSTLKTRGKIKRVLFICRHNRFRSKVAEAFFKNLDWEDEVRSRGLVKDIDVSENVIRAMKKRGVEIEDKKSRILEKEDIGWADLIIIVADNVKLKLDKKVLVWKISDVSQDDIAGINKRIDEIEKRVKKLERRIR
jgi:protein-tyrosine-phosphatase